MPSKRRKIIKYVFGIIGVGITIFSWLVSNHTHFPFVTAMLASKYSRATYAFTRMHAKYIILKKGDAGFYEISEILKGNIKGKKPIIITQIKTLNWGQAAVSTPSGVKFLPYIDLELSFEGAEGRFRDVEARIEEKYLSSPLFQWVTYIFACGITITIISIFL